MALAAGCAVAASKQAVPTVRWAENAPNCTFRDADDGRTYYALSSGDFEITLAVDRQELEKIPHRAKPMLGVFMSFHYKGNGNFEVLQNKMYLEYTKHFQVVKGSLDPDDTLKHLQENVDDLTDEVERHDVKKHPELKDQKESELQARLKDYTEMMDFISTRALKPVTLDRSNSSASGGCSSAQKINGLDRGASRKSSCCVSQWRLTSSSSRSASRLRAQKWSSGNGRESESP